MIKHFLLCSERSGSNLITKILNAHSEVCGPSTKHLMNPMFRNLFRYEPLSINENWERLIDDVLRLFNVDFSKWKSEISKEQILQNVYQGDYVGLMDYFFEREAKSCNKTTVFIKENHIYEFFPYILKYFPESKFLYQVRDPRDVALSWKKNPTHKGGVVAAAYRWKTDQQQLLKIVHFLQSDNKVIAIKYEDLIEYTPKVSREILSFLDLKYEDSILDFHKDNLTKENSITQKAWGNLSKSIMKNNSNKFLAELSKEEIKVIEKICFNEMNHLGYDLYNSYDDLDSFSEVDIQNQNKLDQDLSYNPSTGVKENMKAKAVFYNPKYT